MVNIGIIGAGYIGNVHANVIKNINNAKLEAVVDVNEEIGKKLANEFGANYYSSIEKMLKNETIDGAIVGTPQFLHLEHVKQLTGANINVLCEKPLALTLKEADEMIKMVEESGVIAMTGHIIRFWPEYMKAKEIVDSGIIGSARYCFLQRLAVTPDWGVWRFNEKNSGGAALDLHIHDLDFLLWIFKKPKIVKAQSLNNPKHGGIVHIATSVEFENGGFGLAEGGWEFAGSFPFTMILRILCEKGTIEWTFRAGKNIEQRQDKQGLIIYHEDSSITYPEVESKAPFLLEGSYFVEHVENKKSIEKATFKDARDILELTLAAIQSSNEETIIKL